MFVIETRRLTLSPLGPDDATRLVELCNDRDIARNTARIDSPYTLEDARRFIGYAAGAMAGGAEFPFAVRRDGVVVACAGAKPQRGERLRTRLLGRRERPRPGRRHGGGGRGPAIRLRPARPGNPDLRTFRRQSGVGPGAGKTRLQTDRRDHADAFGRARRDGRHGAPGDTRRRLRAAGAGADRHGRRLSAAARRHGARAGTAIR